jgi:hypothetical protein
MNTLGKTITKPWNQDKPRRRPQSWRNATDWPRRESHLWQSTSTDTATVEQPKK